MPCPVSHAARQASAAAPLPPEALEPDEPAAQDRRQALMRQALPIGPGSLLWECAGDLRGLLVIFRVGLIQNMHPAVSRALEEHSGEVFLKNPWNRLLRSIPPIMGVIYDPQPDEVGRQVRDFHVQIKGRLSDGRAYHSLHPDIYFWTHATFVEGVIAARAVFDTPFTPAQKERLYRESITWYSRYGVSMRPVPPDYASFERYWNEMLPTLQPTPITHHAIHMGRTPRPFESIPRPVWWLLDPLVNRFSQWLGRGTLPPVLRQKLGMRWSRADQALLRVFAAGVRVAFAVMPTEWRYLPTAKVGRRVAREQVRARVV
ncbi:oxygenase MpaB family protein [Aquabacterium sp. A3]|uniref:oxygenase MpaB family protein n=1 Tax=Aquabacterium sp. A3 TaxID=3132829 RepID=UPI00311A5535